MIARVARPGVVDVWVSAQPTGCSDAIVHRVLGRYAAYSGAEVRHQRDAHGRLVAGGDGGLRISVSHAEDVLLVAIGIRCRLGIDIEPVNDRGIRRLWHHALTDSELAELERHDSVRRTEVFLGYWTRKEALLKAAGVGLAVEPRLIELPPAGQSPHPVIIPEMLGHAGEWWLAELGFAEYATAVAVDVPAPRIHLLPFDERIAGNPRDFVSPRTCRVPQTGLLDNFSSWAVKDSDLPANRALLRAEGGT